MDRKLWSAWPPSDMQCCPPASPPALLHCCSTAVCLAAATQLIKTYNNIHTHQNNNHKQTHHKTAACSHTETLLRCSSTKTPATQYECTVCSPCQREQLLRTTTSAQPRHQNQQTKSACALTLPCLQPRQYTLTNNSPVKSNTTWAWSDQPACRCQGLVHSVGRAAGRAGGAMLGVLTQHLNDALKSKPAFVTQSAVAIQIRTVCHGFV